MLDAVRSVDGVCDVEWLRGAAAGEASAPDVLFEVPHGATLGRHFDALRRELVGDYDDDLREFFFVNTDVGAPELARAAAVRLVAARPECSALVVRCHIPRTFIDCNRRVDRDAHAAASRPGEPTPGLQPWVRQARDRELLLDRYFAYRDVVEAAFAAVCGGERPGGPGIALCVHTYAPRSIDVAVDDDIVGSLRAAYAPDRVETWPLRAPVDLITHDPQGTDLAHPLVVAAAEREFAAVGFDVIRNGTYSLHPSTLAHDFARRYPGRTLCLELRRDLPAARVRAVRRVDPRPRIGRAGGRPAGRCRRGRPQLTSSPKPSCRSRTSPSTLRCSGRSSGLADRRIAVATSSTLRSTSRCVLSRPSERS